MKIEIRTPISPKEWEEYYDLRYNILRKPLGQAIGSERTDEDLTGFHFALYENGITRGVARLDQSSPKCSQVRFLAVDDDSQGKGYGKMLMDELETASKKYGNTEMMLHAREESLEFYNKLDYKLIEKSHLLFGQIQHFLMTKKY